MMRPAVLPDVCGGKGSIRADGNGTERIGRASSNPTLIRLSELPPNPDLRIYPSTGRWVALKLAHSHTLDKSTCNLRPSPPQTVLLSRLSDYPRPKRVRAWVRFGPEAVRVDAKLVRSTPLHAAGIELRAEDQAFRCWVWGNAVQLDNEGS